MSDILREFSESTPERPFQLWSVSLGSEWCEAIELTDAERGLSDILQARIYELNAIRLEATRHGELPGWFKRIGLPTGPRRKS